ncbi:hypothetical protein K469DRAFT_753068 [Zopfia rhizophila CBS 207.26]|uniref:Prion-inhibition and propagation HeLo domain-containing protein n=1 Tax=Zopfia rhizophila CBS 207.26 TaxID=1314779 RepID=A0A6A6DN73_9PEZI|nr:hypothetical protein K469DRAFT_753068 [Zopfia rhizophila CBS 207.26]
MTVEPVSLAVGIVGLASLFKTCIECVDYIEAGKGMSKDLSVSFTLLEIQKCRVLICGERLGVCETVSSRRQSRYLEDPTYQATIVRTLNDISMLFQDSEVLNKKYGLERRDDCSGPLQQRQNELGRHAVFKEKYKTFVGKMSEKGATDANATEGFSHFPENISKEQKDRTILAKARWAVHDRSKFKSLVDDLTNLVNGLTSFVSLDKDIEQEILDEIRRMRDVTQLELIERACEQQYPKVSRAASIVLEITSRKDTEVDEEGLQEKIDTMTAISEDDHINDDIPGSINGPSTASLPNSILATVSSGVASSDDQPLDPTIIGKVFPSDSVVTIILIASDSKRTNFVTNEPVLTEGELRSLAESEFTGNQGKLSGIRIADYMAKYLPLDSGWAHVYVAPTLHHMELSITISEKLRQIPVIRIDHRLLSDRSDIVLKSLSATFDVLTERILHVHEAHGPKVWSPVKWRYDNGNQGWPALLRYLDQEYLDKMILSMPDDNEDSEDEDGETTETTFGLHSVFAEHKNDLPNICGGSIIVIAERSKIRELLESPIVECATKPKNKSITQLYRIPRSTDQPDMQFWRAEFWATLK